MLSNDFFEKLNEGQKNVVLYKEGTAVVSAGAGSGKTHTLISRVSYLVDQGESPERILMLTFTNAAADEMKERACGLSDDRCGKIVACTYHTFCNMMLRRYGRRIGIVNYEVISSDKYETTIRYVKTSDPYFDNMKGFPSVSDVAKIISMSVNMRVSIDSLLKKNDRFSKYRDYAKDIEYLHNKVVTYMLTAEHQLLYYDDLLLYMIELLAYDDICESIASGFKYIMVDEFQDTNDLQELMITYLSKYNSNIVVVGDISQSIYAFRGANVKNLQQFPDKFNNTNVMVLNQNYRSDQKILDFANSVMQTNVKSWQYYDMFSDISGGEYPVVYRPYDQHVEADDVLSLIGRLHDNGFMYKDIAVLMRRSNATYSLESLLDLEEISFRKMGGLKLMDKECVGDVLSYFSVIINPYDLLSWFRLLRLHPGIGEKYAKLIADTCVGNSDFLVDDKLKPKSYYKELYALNEAYNKFKHIDDFELLFDEVVSFYLDVRLRACNESRMNDENKQKTLELIDNSKEDLSYLKIIAMRYSDMVSFMDDLVLDNTHDNDSGDDVLTLSTIHSAKGLEWKCVIIMDCVDDIMCTSDVCEYGSFDDEEDLRCFYVAITRAKCLLYMFAPKYIGYRSSGMSPGKLCHYVRSADASTYTIHN